MLSITITNTTSAVVQVSDIYASLAKASAPGSSLTITRSQAELDSMQGLKTLVHAGTVTLDIVPSSTNVAGMSIPMKQNGVVSALSVAAVAIVTSAVTFPIPYDSTVTPNVQLNVVEGATTGFKANTYVRSLTNTGFTIALDVTTDTTGTTSVSWTSCG